MAWSFDDTTIPKKCSLSVGVARQYCGNLGKEENFQPAVSISVVNEAVSLPVVYRLYLPKEWTGDRARCREAGVPDEVTFQTKWQIGLEQVDRLLREGVPLAPVVADAGYGVATEFRKALTTRGIPQCGGHLEHHHRVDRRGATPAAAPMEGGRATPGTDPSERAPSPDRPAGGSSGAPFRAVGGGLLAGGNEGRAFLSIRPNSRSGGIVRLSASRSWVRGMAAPRMTGGSAGTDKCWLPTMPPETTMELLVRLTKVRWRIERDYPELKGEFGLDHFEGRGWREFHHHATLCIAAYGFLAAERARLSPPQPQAFLPAARSPRGLPSPTRATHRKLDHDAPSPGRPLISSGIPAPSAGVL